MAGSVTLCSFRLRPVPHLRPSRHEILRSQSTIVSIVTVGRAPQHPQARVLPAEPGVRGYAHGRRRRGTSPGAMPSRRARERVGPRRAGRLSAEVSAAAAAGKVSGETRPHGSDASGLVAAGILDCDDDSRLHFVSQGNGGFPTAFLLFKS